VKLEADIVRFCAGFAAHPDAGHLVVLYGNNGTGKTHSAKAVCKWARHIAPSMIKTVVNQTALKQPDVAFVHWPTMLDNLKSGQWSLVDDAEGATLLILDEVGGGHDPSKMGLDKLCRILSRRESRWTMVTTNLLPEAWEEAFDRRVASRLFRSAEHIDLSNVPDFATA